MKHPLTFALVAASLTSCAAGGPASWSYVEDSWGGMRVEQGSTDGHQVDKGVCGSGSLREVTARVERPGPGRYPVVYDDESAAFPVVGEVQVE